MCVAVAGPPPRCIHSQKHAHAHACIFSWRAAKASGRPWEVNGLQENSTTKSTADSRHARAASEVYSRGLSSLHGAQFKPSKISDCTNFRHSKNCTRGSRVPLPTIKLVMLGFIFGFLHRFSQNKCYTLECLSYDIDSKCVGMP